MAGEFQDKVAVVTGAASGIGAAVARQLAREGARVVAADLDAAAVEALAGEIAAAGGEARAFAVDVAQATEVEAMVRFAVDGWGALHLAVNNAGIGGPAERTADYPLDGWSRVVAINLDGAFFGLKYQIPAIIAAGGGAIVNMASILGSVGFATAPAYVAAKHGLVGLTKTAAMEYATEGVRINAVGPGFIDTPMLSKNLEPETLDAIAAQHPVKRLGLSEEVAELTCFLLSERASFITGSYHLVDGGYTAQ
jgi:NAD(P)-dependent dehydrogenase (short-subunit alcohol dehydrogenase family)